MTRHPAGFVVMACAAFALAASGSPRPQAVAQPANKAVEKWEYGSLTVASGNRRPAWVTGAGEVKGEDWTDLADQLKVKLKGGESLAQVRVAVLNRLGDQGWELVSHAIRATEKSSSETYTFKRRIP